MNAVTMAERLAWSDGVSVGLAVEDILLDAIPQATDIVRSTSDEDRTGVDWWVHRMNGRPLGVDLKARSKDYAPLGRDDLALEVWSVVAGDIRRTGWTLDGSKAADYILWWWQDTGRWCLVPFPMLCVVFREHFAEWMSTYREWTQDSGGWTSSCIFVPRTVVWRAIYDRFGGQLSKGAA